MGTYVQIIGSIILALIPALIWSYIFNKKQPEKKSVTINVFIIGALSVLPILFYRYLWNYFPWINAFQYTEQFNDTIINIASLVSIPLSVIFTFMLVGIIEEVAKHYCVRGIDHKLFHHIDDVIEFSIIAALGFSFTENILYFQSIWEAKGLENLLKPFLFRSTFSTFAHVMFSGMFGYYYGMAIFAKPILQEDIKQRRGHLARWFYRVFHWHTASVFSKEKVLKGLLVATLLHAGFNILLELNLVFLTVPYLVAGYLMLSYLFDKKENHKRYDLLMNKQQRSCKNPL